MKLCDNPADVMERFRMSFLNEIRSCVFKNDSPGFLIGGEMVGPFQTGIQANLPNWVIEKLQLHDMVDLTPEDAYESLRRLQNLYRTEEQQPHKLQTFHPFLYAALNRKKHRLQSDKTSMGPRIYDEIEKMQRMVPFLIETRLSKIIRVAKSGAYQEKRKQMTKEERWLCEELVSLLSSWRETIMD